jgi:gliding motility-associated-like protein
MKLKLHIAKLILLQSNLLIVFCMLFYNSHGQRVLNGSVEDFISYYDGCNADQDSLKFSQIVNHVSLFIENEGLNDGLTWSYMRTHHSVDTCTYPSFVTNGLHGSAFLRLASFTRQCPPGTIASIGQTFPKFNFKLSDSIRIGKHYIIRFSMLPTDSNTSIYFGYSTANKNYSRTYFEKNVPNVNTWRQYSFMYTPDSNYNYITVSRENRPRPNCYGNLPVCLFDNLILDTCVLVGTKQTVLVSPCQSAFPITLQSARKSGSMYFWSNDDTLPATVVNDTGVYLSFVYDSIGCAVIDSFIVQYDSVLVEGSSKEMQLCSNASITLLSDTGASWYEWNTGATTRVIFVSDTGLYWVKSKKNNCIRIDTFVVKPYAVSSIFTASQRKVCNLTVATLDATHPQYNRYMWSTGDTIPVISVSQSGKYYVTASDSLCSITDSVDVLIINQAPETIDTGICIQASLTLQARIAESYLWSTGDTTATLNITQSGVYTVIRTIQQCQLTDTFVVGNYPTPVIKLADTTICMNTILVLVAETASRYQWSTGDTTQVIQVTDAGIYSVIKTIPPCQGTETFNVSTYALPQIVTVKDTTVCFDEVKQILLDAGQFSKYLWEPTGETTRTIYSNTAQIYKLTVTDTNTCVNSKDFAVMEECPYSLYVPNAFSPNNDGVNDVLVIKGNRIDSFRMMIINRWGQIVFEADRMEQYWDATNCADGVYTILIEYTAIGKTNAYKGTVTVLR